MKNALMILKIKQATHRGFIELHVPGVFDASYPNSKNRRGRVQAGGIRFAGRPLRPAPDGVCNCISTVTKDFLIILKYVVI